MEMSGTVLGTVELLAMLREMPFDYRAPLRRAKAFLSLDLNSEAGAVMSLPCEDGLVTCSGGGDLLAKGLRWLAVRSRRLSCCCYFPRAKFKDEAAARSKGHRLFPPDMYDVVVLAKNPRWVR